MLISRTPVLNRDIDKKNKYIVVFIFIFLCKLVYVIIGSEENLKRK